MSITAEDFATIGLPVDNPDAYTVLTANSAFEWIKDHTILDVDLNDVQTLSNLPSVAKLFVIKFIDVMNLTTGVASESIDTLSHSFDTDKAALIWQYANELLSAYMKSQVTVYPAKRKW